MDFSNSNLYNVFTMKKSLKYVLIALGVLVLTAIAIVRPWQYISLIPFVGQNAALTVNSISGKADVYLDDKKIGETPLSSENLNPGDHTVTVHRIAEDDDFYEEISRLIHLESNTRTFVEVEVGPTEQFSSIKVMYYDKIQDKNPTLFLDTSPSECVVWIDDVRYGNSPVTSDKLKAGRHELKITHDGYEDLETSFILREGYTLIANIQLMAKPIDLQ